MEEEIFLRNTAEEFLQIYDAEIKREGKEKLLKWLKSGDFFEAPASYKFHSSFKGGLALHSINVYKRLKKNVANEFGSGYSSFIDDESIAICGLLHDVCKANYYKVEMRNVKEDGVWVQRPYYTVEEKFPYGHGEKSVYIINSFMRLKEDEAMAINWHMGGFDARIQGGASLTAAYENSVLSVLLHVSDLQATYIDEDRRR